jgi:hypothetical protein
VPYNTIIRYKKQIRFDILFRGYYLEALKATLEFPNKANVLPAHGLGEVSQGGFTLYGGTLYIVNDSLNLTLDVQKGSPPTILAQGVHFKDTLRITFI